MKKQDIISLSAVLLGFVALVVMRVYLEIPNFNPLGAVALMGGILFSSKLLRWIVPIGALFLGDIYLGLSSPIAMEYLFSIDFLFVYASFAVIILIGTFLSKEATLSKVIGGSLLAAIAFFLISNTGSWITMPVYSKDLSGLLDSYFAALPFSRATLIGQVLFSVVIFITYNFATKRKLVIA